MRGGKGTGTYRRTAAPYRRAVPTGGRMNLQSYLDEMGVHYRLSYHATAYTAQDLAMVEHVPGRKVIKPVVVRADGEFVMCALPACHRVDLDELKCQLDAADVSLADEQKLAELFPGFELGAAAPIGR